MRRRGGSERPSRKPALRFSGRLQLLSGVGFTLPRMRATPCFTAYVPLDVEIAVRARHPLSIVLGGVAYNAPFLVELSDGGVSAAARAGGACRGAARF